MCSPLAIAGVGVAAVSAIGGKISADKAKNANTAAALSDLSLVYGDLNERGVQEQAAASQQRLAIQEESAQAQGTTIAGAATGNISGNTVDALLQDIVRQESNATGTVDRNLQNTLDQIQRSKRGARAEAENRIRGVQSPSWLGVGLKIGGAALDAASALKVR